MSLFGGFLRIVANDLQKTKIHKVRLTEEQAESLKRKKKGYIVRFNLKI